MATRTYTIERISPLSVFRTAFTLSLVGLASWILCVVILYYGLDSVGVWEKLNNVIGGIGSDQKIGFGFVISFAALIGAIITLIISIMAPLTAVVYNASFELFGGIKVKLRKDL